MHPDAPERDGPVLGSFRLGEALGTGPFATTFEAVQEGTDRAVLVKIARRDRFRGDVALAVRDLFASEARMLSRAWHPNLVTVFAAGELDDGRPLIVLEHIDAPTLRALLDDQAPLEPREILQLFEGLAAALDALHTAGIAHRAVTPDDIRVRLGRTPIVKLGGTGVAKLPPALAHEFSLGNAWRYMAPEHLRGAPNDKSDIYSLGAILWWALLGEEYLATERDMPGFVRRVLATAVPPDPRAFAPDLSSRLAAMVSASMSPDPAGRPSAAHFRMMLRATLDVWVEPGAAERSRVEENAMNRMESRPPLTGRSRRVVTTRPLGAGPTRDPEPAVPTGVEVGTRLLLVDSDRLAASALIGTLVSYDLDVASGITRAMQMLKSEHFDIVMIAELVDGSSGYELVEVARSLALPPMPRFFVHGRGPDRGRWATVGAEGYVSLGWTADAILERLASRPAVSGPATPPPLVGPAPATRAGAPGIDRMPLWLGELEDAIVRQDATTAEELCQRIANEAQTVELARLATRAEMLAHAARARRPSQVRLFDQLMEEYEVVARETRAKTRIS